MFPYPSDKEFKSELRAKRFKQIFLTHTGIGLKFGLPLTFTFFPELSKKVFFHFYAYALYKSFRSKRLKLGPQNYVAIHNHWSSGYHHWVSECLIKVFHLPRKLQAYTLLIPEAYPDFVFQSIEMFPFQDILRVPRENSLYMGEITLVENPISGRYNPTDIKNLRTHSWEYFKIVPYAKELLYISRAKVPTRNISNELDLILLLKKLGFRVIMAEDYSFEEQVRLFSQCKILASVHGAGLTNCIFMPPGGYLYEFYRRVSEPSKNMNPCFVNLAEASGLHYQVQFCDEGSNTHKEANNAPLIVDLQEFERQIKTILENGYLS